MPVRFSVKKIRALRLSLTHPGYPGRRTHFRTDLRLPTPFANIHTYVSRRRGGLTRRRPLALLKTGGFWSGPPWGHG